MSFLFKELSEKEKKEIRKEAKELIEVLSKRVDSLKLDKVDSGIKRKNCFRKEKGNFNQDKEFRKRIFKNSPNKNEDFIIAEKKRW